MVGVRSSSSTSALLLRVVLLSICTALLCPVTGANNATGAGGSSTDLRREQRRGREQSDTGELKTIKHEMLDGVIPVVDSFYVDLAKDNNKASHGGNNFRALQESVSMMTVGPTSAPTATPTASPSSASTASSTPAESSATSMPAETSAAGSYRGSSSSCQSAAAAAVEMTTLAVVAAALAAMA